MAIVNGVEILESDVDRFIELMGDRALPYKNPTPFTIAITLLSINISSLN